MLSANLKVACGIYLLSNTCVVPNQTADLSPHCRRFLQKTKHTTLLCLALLELINANVHGPFIDTIVKTVQRKDIGFLVGIELGTYFFNKCGITIMYIKKSN